MGIAGMLRRGRIGPAYPAPVRLAASVNCLEEVRYYVRNTMVLPSSDAGRLGQGWGRDMIRASLDHLFADPAVTVVQTDPAPTNARAIRCYLRAGFRPIGPVTTPDGAALLMRCARPGSMPFAGTPAAPSTPAQP